MPPFESVLPTMHSIRNRDVDLPAERSDGRLSPQLRRAFSVSRRAAAHVLRRRFRVLELLKKAYLKLGIHDDAMGRVREDFGTMMRMAKAWALRDYRSVPWKSLVYVVGAIIYFVNPADVIPDVLGGIGFIDDAAVAAAVVRAIQDQLDAFRQWEKESRIDDEVGDVPEASSLAA